MIERENANIVVTINIPSTRVMAAAELVLKEYEPLAKDALDEVISELNSSEFIKNKFKEQLMCDIKKIITNSYNDIIKKAIDNKICDYYDDISDKIEKLLIDK